MAGTTQELEVDIEDRFVEEVKARGGVALKLFDKHKNGFPDRTVILYGEIWFVEFKRPKQGKRSPNQKWWRTALLSLGVKCGVATSVAEAWAIGDVGTVVR